MNMPLRRTAVERKAGRRRAAGPSFDRDPEMNKGTNP